MSKFLPYRFDRRLAAMWWPLGTRLGRDGVTITDDGLLVATYGRKRLETSLSNVDEAHVTRDYRWWTAVGIRLSFADDGLTFGTNSEAGVCIHFHEKVPAVVGRKDHSALTATVDDLNGLVEALAAPD